MLRAVTLLAAVCGAIASVGAGRTARAASLSPGDILVVNNSMAGASIVRIDPVSGDRAVVSGLYLDEQNQTVEVGAGRSIREAYGVDIDPQGRIVVAVTELSASNDPLYGIVRIDPATGDREVIVEFPTASPQVPGVSAELPYDVAVDASGNYYISMFDSGFVGQDAILKFTPGDSLAEFVTSSDESLVYHYGLSLNKANNSLLAARAALYGEPPSAVSMIDLMTFTETAIASAPSIIDVVETPDGRLFGLGNGVVDSIDPSTGDVALVTPVGVSFPGFWNMTWEPSTESVLMSGRDFAAVVRIDVASGVDTLVSGALGNAIGDGPGLSHLQGIVVVPNPIPEPTAGVLIAIGTVAIAAMRQRSKRRRPRDSSPRCAVSLRFSFDVRRCIAATPRRELA